MRHNERNSGNWTLDGEPKKNTSKKLNADEKETALHILQSVYDAMEYEQDANMYVEGGRITLSLTGEQMYDLFEAIRKLK